MFDVQVISASLSQKPIVSPYQRGTSAPRRGTAPVLVELAADVDVRDEVVRDDVLRICTTSGVTMTCGRAAAYCAKRRMNPSGQQ